MFFARQQREAAERQRQLQARSGLLRQQLADDAQVLQRPLALADRLRQGWRWLRAHPELPAGAVLVVALVRPRRTWWLLGRAWAGWRLWRRVQGWHGLWVTASGHATGAPRRAPRRPPPR